MSEQYTLYTPIIGIRHNFIICNPSNLLEKRKRWKRDANLQSRHVAMSLGCDQMEK